MYLIVAQIFCIIVILNTSYSWI